MSCVKKKSVMLIIFYLILFLIFFPVNKTKYVSSYYRAHIKKIIINQTNFTISIVQILYDIWYYINIIYICNVLQH
ncbi:hypothetical protein PFNF54_00148 [Plasmodium falciparum NF54]|uniref:Uncharacterized protein n=1 Tax=Plasmodium falciparum (isolate NF54) TaxID=5843 RepID=W7KBH9_PLAFO|nr:hypothetical protein PFNF54_00148 [Plasmodium falciparum NF54]